MGRDIPYISEEMIASVTQCEFNISQLFHHIDTIEDFHRESKHSAEALSTLKQDLQVKVLEIGLLKEKLADKDHIMTQLHNNVKKVFDSIY